MKRLLVSFTLFFILAGYNNTCVGRWGLPREKDYFSENEVFVGHVTPADGTKKAFLEVSKVKDTERAPLWQCTLGNEGTPEEVFVSNDGNYVATLNEVSRRVPRGRGDYVIAFYNKDRLIKNYSLEQILHYPEKIDEKEFGDDIFNAYRNKSRENENKVYWLIKFSDENYNNFRDLIRSNNMIKGKERDLKSDAEGKLLHEEKNRQNKLRRE